MDLSIKGRKALITGASSGLGEAAATALAAEGVEITINGRDQARLDAAASRIEKATGVVPAMAPGDVSKSADIDHILKAVGDTDILVSNSGGPPSGLFHNLDRDDWPSAADLLVHSAVNLTRGLLDGMRQRKWGRLIFITSVSVLRPIDDLILSNTYRSAVAGFCKSIAINYGAEGITANCVCPGYTATDRLWGLAEKRASRSDKSSQEVMDGLAESVPAGRLGKPEELAALIAFLASERAAYINGSTIAVDGGFILSG